jgi:ABC-2 type transport system ATP-binding protein
MEETERVADEIAVIDHGRIVAESTAAALREQTGGFAFGMATDFAILSLLAAILLAIGAWLFSKIEV